MHKFQAQVSLTLFSKLVQMFEKYCTSYLQKIRLSLEYLYKTEVDEIKVAGYLAMVENILTSCYVHHAGLQIPCTRRGFL